MVLSNKGRREVICGAYSSVGKLVWTGELQALTDKALIVIGNSVVVNYVRFAQVFYIGSLRYSTRSI